jgi:hypothetical protein
VTFRVHEVIEKCENLPHKEFWGADDLAYDLDVSWDWDCDPEDIAPKRMSECYFHTWICTDTQVGWRLVYLDSEPVAFMYLKCRKCDIKIFWVSEEAALKTRKFLEGLKIPQRDNFELVDMDGFMPFDKNLLTT